MKIKGIFTKLSRKLIASFLSLLLVTAAVYNPAVSLEPGKWYYGSDLEIDEHIIFGEDRMYTEGKANRGFTYLLDNNPSAPFYISTNDTGVNYQDLTQNGKEISVTFHTSSPVVIDHFKIVSGGDTYKANYAHRSPTAWNLKAGNSLDSLNTVLAQNLPINATTAYEENLYEFENTTPYKYYKFTITALAGAGRSGHDSPFSNPTATCILSDILIGGPDPAAHADHDNIGFASWDSATSLPTTAGNYSLSSDVTISSTWNVPSGTTNLCLNGHGIIRTNASGTTGSVIQVGSGATLNLYDCGTETRYYTVSDPTANGAGLGTVVEESAYNAAAENARGTFTGGYITGGVISGNADAQHLIGGGVNVAGGSFTMYGGTIIGNKVCINGGAVKVKGAGASFVMNGGALLANYNDCYGGAISVGDNGSNRLCTLIINGGTIARNWSGRNGGAVHLDSYNHTFIITGGSIVNNYTNGNYDNGSIGRAGGGILKDGTLLKLSGSPVIKDNFFGGNTANNVYLRSDKSDLMALSGLTSGADIGVAIKTLNASSDIKIATGAQKEDVRYIRYDLPDEGCVIFCDGAKDWCCLDGEIAEFNGAHHTHAAGTLWAAVSPAAAVTDGATATVYTGFSTALNAWTAGSTLKLMSDVTTSSTITVPTGKHTLDLNGHDIKAGSTGYSVITVGSDAELTVDDTHQGGRITGGSVGQNYGGGVTVDGGTFTLKGGAISGNANTYGGIGNCGGGVHVAGSGTFTMQGGEISGNTSYVGGGICTDSSATTVSITGGVIKNNQTERFGSAVWAGRNNSAVFSIGGDAEIINNISKWTSDKDGEGTVNFMYDTLSLSGNPTIRGEWKANGTSSRNTHINLDNDGSSVQRIKLNGALTNDTGTPKINMSPIYRWNDLTNGNTFVFTENWSTYMGTANPADYFGFDSSATGFRIVRKGGEAAFAGGNTLGDLYVTFDSNGADGTMDPQLATTASVTLNQNTFNSTDCDFAGWNTKADGSGTPYADGATVTLSGDLTLYAQWDKKLFEGKGTEAEPYLIQSANDWDALSNHINNGGTTYNGKYFKLTKNISVTTVLGNRPNNSSDSNDNVFCGTFDGGGNELEVNINNSGFAAPFGVAHNATIKNLNVTGTVHSSSNHASGLVAASKAVNVYDPSYLTIQNVTVSTNVSCNSHVAGIVGHAHRADITMENVVFNGSLSASSVQGGFIGWGGLSNGVKYKATFKDCMFNGTYRSGAAFYPVAFASGQGNATLINDFYTTSLGSGGSPIAVTGSGQVKLLAVAVEKDGAVQYFDSIATAATGANWTVGSTLKLMTDVTTGSTVTVPSGEHTLDLNGYGLKRTGSGCLIKIPSNADLTVIDSRSADITHYYYINSSTNLAVTAETEAAAQSGNSAKNGSFTGGYITGGNNPSGASEGGGGISVLGRLTMNGGTVIGNSVAGAGGGICVYNAGSASLTGTNIIGNKTGNVGAGIDVNADSGTPVVTLNNCVIRHNHAESNTGGIAARSGSVTLTDCDILDNTAKTNSAGMNAQNCHVTLENVTIKGNATANSSNSYAPGISLRNNNYKNFSFTIKGTVTIDNNTMAGNADNSIYIYNGRNISIGGTLTNTAPIRIKLQNGSGTFTTGWKDKMGDADPAKYFISDNTDYEVRLENGEAIIAYPFVSGVGASGFTGDYDGKSHTVSVTAPEGATVKYGTDEGDYTLTAAPSYTNAGTYNVYYKVSQDKRTDVTGYATVQINKIDVTVTVTGHNNTVDYNGNAHSAEGYDAEFSTELYSSSDFVYNGRAEAVRTDAGTTDMGLKAELFENKNDNFGTVTFNITDGYVTVNKINAVVTITGNNVVVDYNGNAHSADGYNAEFSTEVYSLSDFTYNGRAEAIRTDAGTTYMGLKAELFENKNDNFGSVTFNVTDGYVTVNQISAVVTVTGNVVTTDYDGDAHNVVGYEAVASSDLYDVTKDFTFSGEAEAIRTDAGTTYMGLKAELFENKNDNFGSVTFNVTDGYITVNAVDAVIKTAPASTNPTYNGSNKKLVTAGDVIGGKLYYALGDSPKTLPADSAYSTELPTAKEIGSYYVWYKVSADSNHIDIAPAYVKVTLAESDWVTLSGTLYESDGKTPLANAVVTLTKGNQNVDYVITGADGKYNFIVPAGIYNVVAENGDITETMIIKAFDDKKQDFVASGGKTESIVNIEDNGDDGFGVAVGGLNEEAFYIRKSSGLSDSKSLSLSMTVESKTDVTAKNAKPIYTLATDKSLIFFDAKLEKTVDSKTTVMNSTENVLEIAVPYDKVGKRGIAVYYSDGGDVTTLKESSTGQAGTFRVDVENGFVYIYASEFSTFAIGYTPYYSVKSAVSLGSFEGNVTVVLVNKVTEAVFKLEDVKFSEIAFADIPKGEYTMTVSWEDGALNTLTMPLAVS